jgi:CelD/BcsL family acetyltransferase involved in cellulose biosynthesis
MDRLDYDELERRAEEFDAAVDASQLPDPFCTASAWILPARRAFLPDAEPWVLAGAHGWAPLQRMTTSLGSTLLPLEASWGLAAPIVGPDPVAAAKEVAAALISSHGAWQALFLSGLVRGGPDFTALVHAFGRRFRMGLGQPTVRCVASLDGGMDGFLGRRSAHFRKNLRREVRQGSAALRFERTAPTDAAEALDLYERVLRVEAKSWKAADGHGIHEGPMRLFYADMIPRLARAGNLRLTFAWEGDEAVGYVLGGVRGATYRGLQISFDQRLTHLAPGKLMHLFTIAGLCEEGVAAYDLGTEMDYKRAWAELRVETVPLVVR